jgi:hypothetical protein
MDPAKLAMLSPAARAAIMEHMNRSVIQATAPAAEAAGDAAAGDDQGISGGAHGSKECSNNVRERFGMSQFWYTHETSRRLAQEAMSVGGTAAELAGLKRVAFVSCPSAYIAAREIVDDETEPMVFEFDRRFGDEYGDAFCFFDFNHPEKIPEDLRGTFDYVMADPPYLDPNCMRLTIEAMRLLARDPETTPMCYNSGAVMAEHVAAFAGWRECRFHPEHASNLQNEFSCFTNYDAKGLGGWYDA